MSATACRPVSRTLSSAGPQPTFTLSQRRQRSVVASMHLLYDAVRVSHSFTPTRTAHAGARAGEHASKLPNFHTQLGPIITPSAPRLTNSQPVGALVSCPSRASGSVFFFFGKNNVNQVGWKATREGYLHGIEQVGSALAPLKRLQGRDEAKNEPFHTV